MEFTSLNESDRFLSYPTNKIIGMVSTPEELHAAIAELNAAGFGEAQVEVLCGRKGAARLDVTGERRGFLARVYRFVEKFGDMDAKHLNDYRSELLNGHFLLAVDVPDDDARTRVVDVFKAHGGHRVNFFRALTIEGLLP